MKKISVSILLIFFFIGCVSHNSHNVNVSKSDIHHIKSESSTAVIEGKKLQYQLWYDKDKWEIINKEHIWFNQVEMEMKRNKIINANVLAHVSQEIFCVVKEDRLTTSLKPILRGTNHNMHVTQKEIRKVNGQEVLCIIGYPKNNPEAEGMMSLAYYLVNNSGAVNIVVATPKNLFNEHESDIFNLLNGLVDTSLPYSRDTVDIESKLLKLKNLKDKGLIDQVDYEKSKDRLLNQF